MKRYRRLLALVALSLLLHLLALVWIARRPAPATVLDAPPAPLTLHLQAPGRAQAPSAAPPPALSAPETVVSDTPDQEAPAPAPAAVSAASAPDPAPTLDAALERRAPAGADTPVQMPGRYRARMPPGASLAYTLAGAGQAGAAATLQWTTDGDAYTLTSDGVLGRLSSRGATNDAGVAPQAASAQDPDGSAASTTFARRTIAIGGRDYPNSTGSQDRASLLLQLMGMGLAEPDQLRGAIEIYVAGAQQPEIQTFQVVDDEALATPLGTLATRHLVQLVRAGEARLEIWLAPEKRWLPVQLRMTAPDGAVSTQTISAIAD